MPQTPVPPSKNPEPTARNTGLVNSLARGLEILSMFSEGDLLGNQQLVALTGLPKATVSRLTATLVQLGYLRTDPLTRKYFMGTHLLGLGLAVQRKIGLVNIARPYMQALSEETGLTVSVGTRDRLGLVLLEVLRPQDNSRLVVNIDVGTVLPIVSTAIGLAYLVAAPVKESSQILEGLRKRFPDEWPAQRERVEQAHAELEQRGFIITQSSWGRDVNGVATPFLLNERNALYVFNCAGPANRLPLARIRNEIGPRLLSLVADVRMAMHQSPRPHLTRSRLYEP